MSILETLDNFEPETNTTQQFLTRSPEGAMDFPKFFRVLKGIWSKAYPNIPIYRAGQEYLNPEFPCITVGIYSEVPARGWPKPRPIEVIPGTSGSNNDLIQTVWFFELIIRVDIFSTQNSGGAETADEICEAFKRLMLDYTYVFLKKGIGDIRYIKRFVDEPVLSVGNLYAVKRSLAYKAISQIVSHTTIDHLNTINAEMMVSWDGDEIVELPTIE